MTAFGSVRILATASSSTLISPCSHSLSRCSSTARSRKASMMPLPCSAAIWPRVLPSSALFFGRTAVQDRVIPPSAADAGRRRIELELDRFGMQLFADLRIAVGFELLLVGGEQDRMPGRQAAEFLAIAHRESVGDAVWRAHRKGANAFRGRRIDLRHLLLPLIRPAHRLA